MATLTVKGTFVYAHEQFNDEESPVFLYLYLDRTFAPLHAAHIAVNPHEATAPQEFTLQGHVAAHYLPGGVQAQGGHAQLPADAKLCAQAYVTTRNSFGIHAREDHGATSLDLRHVHRAWVGSQQAGKTHADLQATLSIHTTGNRATGVVALRIHSMEIHPSGQERQGVRAGGSGIPIGFAAPEPYMNVEENVERLSDTVRTYMETFARERRHFVETVEGSENIVCPLNPSETTVLNSELPMPLVGYDMAESMQVDAGWWVQQAEIMADRQGFTLEEYASHYARLPLETQAAEALALVSQYVQQITYVADKEGGKPNEMFGDALVIDSDDCDGLGEGIELQRRAFVGAHLAQDPAVPAHTRLVFSRMQRILASYVPLLCIEGVSTSHVENVKLSAGAQAHVDNAHYAIKFLPHPLFARYVSNYHNRHPLAHPAVVATHISGRFPHLAQGGATVPVIGATADTQALEGAICADDLPVLMGEGTGILYPLQGEDPLAREREQLYMHAAMAPIKKPQIPPPGPSQFYQVSLIAFTSAFMDTHRVGTFRFCTPNRQLERQGKYSRGATFVDVMRKREDLLLVPFGFSLDDSEATPSISVPLPARLSSSVAVGAGGGHRGEDGVCRYVPEFTRAQWQAIRSTIKTRIPPRHFQPSAAAVLDYESTHPGLDRLATMAPLAGGRTREGVGAKAARLREGNQTRTLHVYVQPEVADAPRWQAYMERHVDGLLKSGGIKGMYYVREIHSDTMTRWRLSFRV